MALSLARSSGVAVRAQQRAAVAARPALPLRRRLAPVPAYKNDSSGLDTEELNKKFNDTLSNTGTFLQTKWEETEDKPAAIMITGAALLALVAANSVVDAVDRIPLISDVIELVGVVVTGWFTYRYLVFGPDREELVSQIKTFLKKVYGK